MGGIFLLLLLCFIMAVASFLAGALPLSMSLSQSQLRLLSSVGVGILVGTSLIVIIPEGIQAAATPSEASHIHRVRSLVHRSPWDHDVDASSFAARLAIPGATRRRDYGEASNDAAAVPSRIVVTKTARRSVMGRDDELEKPAEETSTPDIPSVEAPPQDDDHDDHEEHEEHATIPTLEIGASLIFGFILMFLIDRVPRHATDRLQSTPATQHISLDNLGGGGDTASVDEEADGFLDHMTPSPRRARTLATTLGLVIHAAADGIAMGASSTTSDMKLGFIIFAAIMIHKAPAAFGLTSVLLKQGLSKRAARGHLIVFSLSAPVGALSTWLLITLLGGGNASGDSGEYWTGMLLLFSGGTFLYVAMHAMQEDAGGHEHGSGPNGYAESGPGAQRKQKGPRMRDTLATVGGMMLPLLTQFGHHH